MSKHDLLSETETLLKTLVEEANQQSSGDGGGPDFAERLKVVDVVAKFLIVKNRLVPPQKAMSIFEEMQNGLYGGETGSRAGAAAKPKGRNGAAVLADAGDDI